MVVYNNYGGNAEPRQRLSGDLFAGLVTQWFGKYGWIEALEPINHPDMGLHKSKIFFHIDDVVEPNNADASPRDKGGKKKGWGKGGKNRWKQGPRCGVIVEFYLYQDGRGLGAEGVVSRQVLRAMLPVSEGKRVFLEDGSGIINFEDRHGITLRAFEWYKKDDTKGTLPLLVEIWGRGKAIVSAITELRTNLFCNMELLIPQSRVTNLDLQKLYECSGCEFKMSTLTAIDDPMPCYPLSCTKGDSSQVGRAVLELLSQICDS